MKNIRKNKSKNLSGNYSHKLLDHAKKSATYALKTTSNRVIQKTAEATGDLSGNKIVAAVDNFYDDKITTIVRTFPQNNSK